MSDEVKHCSRCGRQISGNQLSVPDPCCLAPDCEDLTAVSHFVCAPKYVRDEAMEDMGAWAEEYGGPYATKLHRMRKEEARLARRGS